MFFDIGPLELIALVILAILVFGPEKLPKVIQDTARFVRKVREFSDSARDDIRRELGPEFKDFDFEDLNPRNFARKHLLENEDLGLKEIRNGFDLRQELAEVTDAVNGREIAPGGSSAPSPGGSGIDLRKADPASGAAPRRTGPAPGADLPPYDADAT